MSVHTEPWLEQKGEGTSDLVAILVHGRGGNPQDMRTLAARLGLAGVRCIFPAATGGTWYPQGFLAPIEQNEPYLSQALRHYEGIVAGLIGAGVAASRILLGGFSQGACLTAAFLARHPRRYAGALLFTGGLVGPLGTRWPQQPSLAGMPAYVTTSQVDAWVPAGRVEETAAWLRGSGADVTMRIFAQRPHVVSDEEIEEARRLLAGLLPNGTEDKVREPQA